MIQDLIDRHYHSAYEKAWADQAAGRITTDEAIDRCHAAWLKCAALIKRKTGYTL